MATITTTTAIGTHHTTTINNRPRIRVIPVQCIIPIIVPTYEHANRTKTRSPPNKNNRRRHVPFSKPSSREPLVDARENKTQRTVVDRSYDFGAIDYGVKIEGIRLDGCIDKMSCKERDDGRKEYEISMLSGVAELPLNNSIYKIIGGSRRLTVMDITEHDSVGNTFAVLSGRVCYLRETGLYDQYSSLVCDLGQKPLIQTQYFDMREPTDGIRKSDKMRRRMTDARSSSC